MNSQSTKKILMGLVCAALLLFVLAPGTYAGEITGNGKWIAGSPDAPLNGKSECAFSGREDDPFGVKGMLAQSWGQIPKGVRDFLTSIGLNPGIACNPVKAGASPG